MTGFDADDVLVLGTAATFLKPTTLASQPNPRLAAEAVNRITNFSSQVRTQAINKHSIAAQSRQRLPTSDMAGLGEANEFTCALGAGPTWAEGFGAPTTMNDTPCSAGDCAVIVLG